MDVRVGLCGFTVSMRGYGSSFPVVEVQQTFYDPPPDATLEEVAREHGTVARVCDQGLAARDASRDEPDVPAHEARRPAGRRGRLLS
jgi:hypothetical protein